MASFDIKSAPTLVHRAMCGFRQQCEDKWATLYQNPKAKALWDYYEALYCIKEQFPAIWENPKYQEHIKASRPTTGFIAFYNLVQYRIDQIQCDNLLHGNPAEMHTERFCEYRKLVEDEANAEEDNRVAWAETRAAQRFERDAYGHD